MLDSQDHSIQKALLESLDEMRSLLEAHIHNDACKILGEI
jgi:hypothetical protein